MTDLDVAPVADPDVQLLVPADDEPEPELSIVIPALNESLTITDFVEWCHQGLKAADIRGEILIVDSSDDDTADLALAGGARVLKTPAPRARPGLHRRPPLHPRALRADGRRRLHLRLPRARRVRRAVPRGLRVRDGLALEGLDREGGDAGPAPVLRHALHHVDPQPGLRLEVLRHPLRHAGHHPRRARAHGHQLAVVGVRLRDGAQVGAHGAAHRRGPGHVPEGPRGPPQPPQALGLVLAVLGGVDQPAGDVRLRRRLLPDHARASC